MTLHEAVPLISLIVHLNFIANGLVGWSPDKGSEKNEAYRMETKEPALVATGKCVPHPIHAYVQVSWHLYTEGCYVYWPFSVAEMLGSLGWNGCSTTHWWCMNGGEVQSRLFLMYLQHCHTAMHCM